MLKLPPSKCLQWMQILLMELLQPTVKKNAHQLSAYQDSTYQSSTCPLGKKTTKMGVKDNSPSRRNFRGRLTPIFSTFLLY